MKRHESPWHKLTVERVCVVGDGEPCDELDYHVEHPVDCDQLKYGETCWFDGGFWDNDDAPTEPGVYRARVWGAGPDYYGEYDGGNEWEPSPGGKCGVSGADTTDQRTVREQIAAAAQRLRNTPVDLMYLAHAINDHQPGRMA